MSSITMQTVKLAYDTFHGKLGEEDCLPIILLHGYYWGKYVFRDLGQQLANDNKCTVYSLDLRNHGESPAPKGLSMELMAEDVRQFMIDHGLLKAHFVCHSLSSTVPYLIHWTEPDRVGKMVLIDMLPFHTHSKENNEKFAYPQVFQHRNALKLLDPQMALSEAKSKFFKLALTGPICQKYYYRKMASDLVKVNGEFKFRIDLDYLLKRYVNKHLSPGWTCSTSHDILIIRCEGSDKVPDKDFEKALNYAPRMKLVTLKNTTHLLMFERKTEFLQLVKEFLMVDAGSIPDKRTL